MSIYQPTWLYVKQHPVTGLKYFGKTTQNPYRYKGSGNPMFGRKHSEETKEKMRAAKAARKLSKITPAS